MTEIHYRILNVTKKFKVRMSDNKIWKNGGEFEDRASFETFKEKNIKARGALRSNMTTCSLCIPSAGPIIHVMKTSYWRCICNKDCALKWRSRV
jgi:hypothetical protein